jgi:hypothetical protein
LAQCLLLCAHLGLKTNCFFLLAKLSLTQSAQLPRTLEGGLKTLHAETRTILAGLLTKLLLTGKLLLRLIEGSHVPTGADVTHLSAKIALALCLNNSLTTTAKSPGANCLRLISHPLHLGRTLGFPKLGLHRHFNERVHVLSGSASGELPHAERTVLSAKGPQRRSTSHLPAKLTKLRRAHLPCGCLRLLLER